MYFFFEFSKFKSANFRLLKPLQILYRYISVIWIFYTMNSITFTLFFTLCNCLSDFMHSNFLPTTTPQYNCRTDGTTCISIRVVLMAYYYFGLIYKPSPMQLPHWVSTVPFQGYASWYNCKKSSTPNS